MAILTEYFYDYPKPLQTHAGIITQIRQKSFPSVSFLVRYSLTILAFN
jgi:hypothetical protein